MMGHAGPWMMGYGGMGRGMMGWGVSGQAVCNAMTSHVEGGLGFIKAELKITDAQESLWQAYAAAARDIAGPMQTHCAAMMKPHGASTVSLPERLDLNEQFMASQLDAIRAINKTLKPLYGALSDSQKQTADQFFWGHMGMM